MNKSGLENQRVFTGTVGSNPTLSVKTAWACPVGGRVDQFFSSLSLNRRLHITVCELTAKSVLFSLGCMTSSPIWGRPLSQSIPQSGDAGKSKNRYGALVRRYDPHNPNEQWTKQLPTSLKRLPASEWLQVQLIWLRSMRLKLEWFAVPTNSREQLNTTKQD
jgi:hypothetical protein